MSWKIPFWNPAHVQDGRPVAEDFEYRSNANPQWLTPEELKACISDLQVET
jgi:hypothetical protein